MKKIKEFWKGVASEFKKVRWPDKKEMFKYTAATLAFIFFFAIFFEIIHFILAYIKSVFG